MNPHLNLSRCSISIVTLLFFSALACADVPELNIQTGHPNGVGAISFSADGKTLASGGRDGLIKLWDTASRRELMTWTGNEGGVWSLAYSPDGRTLASGGKDNLVKLWEPATGNQLGVLAGHSGIVTALIFANDGKTLITGSSDQTIKVWDLSTRRELRTLKGHTTSVTSLSLSPDGKTLASTGYEKIIRLWDLGSGQELRPIEGHGDAVISVDFSPRGKLLASTSLDRTVRLWDVDSRLEVRTVRDEFKVSTAVAFSVDGQILATVYSGASFVINGKSNLDGVTLKLWEVATGRELHAMQGPFMSKAIAFSRDGQTVASGGMVAHVQLWSVKTGREVGILSGISNIHRTYALSPDGKKLASGPSSRFVAPSLTNDYAEGDERGNMIKLWDMTTGELIQTLRGHAAPVYGIIFSDDGKYLATAASTELKIWDAATGRELRTLKGDEYGLEPMTFDGSGGRIVTKSGDQIIKLWDITTGRELLRTKNGYGGTATIAADADGRRIAVRDGEKNIKVLSVESGGATKTLKGHQEWVSSLAFAHKGNILASASQDKTVKLWDVRKGVELFTLRGHKGGVGAVVFSRDDKVLVSGAGNEVKFWDPASGKELRTLTANCGGVHTLRFDHDARTMTCSGSRTDIKLLDLATGKELATVVAVDRQDWITVTPEGLFDSSHNAWNYLNWRFSKSLHDVAPAEAFFSEFYYPGLLGEIFDGRPLEAPSEIGKKDRRQPQLQLNLIGAPAHSGAAITARMIKVRVEVAEAPADEGHTAGSGVRDVRLFRNGSLVKVWRGEWGEQDGCELQPRPTAQSARRTTCTATIPIVAGENRLTAYAFNSDNVKSPDGELIATGAESLKRMSTLYVLNIGVGKYENPQYDLSYAADDALAFGDEVKLQQERIKRFQRVEVLTLLNQEATKAHITAALTKLSEVVQPEDGVMIYFSGHGTAQGDRFYLIPHDMGYMGSRTQVNATGLQKILAHSISDRELEEIFRGIDAGHLLLVIDACNSGKALQADDWRRGPMNTRGLAQLAYEKGMYILTASQSYELAFESKALKHGYLTYALIEGLKTRAADTDQSGEVLLREWFEYAVSRVLNLRQEQMEQQAQRQDKDLIEVEERGSVQQPRVFYRRESDVQPFVIARPTSVP